MTRLYNLNSVQILFNLIHDVPETVSNFVFLVVTLHVYKARCYKVLPNIRQFKAEIFNFRNYEKYYSTKNNKLEKHLKKWYCYITIGGSRGRRRRAPPNRINFFRFRICFCQKVYTSEVGTPPMGRHPPQWKILDLPLITVRQFEHYDTLC